MIWWYHLASNLHCGLSSSDMNNLCKWKVKYFLALLDTWLTFLKAIAKPCSNSDWFSKLESRHGHWALDSTYWTGKSRKMILHQNLEFPYFSPGKVHYAKAIMFELWIHYWMYHFHWLRLEPFSWYNYHLKCSRNTSKLDTFLTWNPSFEWIGTKTETFSTIFWNVKLRSKKKAEVLQSWIYDDMYFPLEFYGSIQML